MNGSLGNVWKNALTDRSSSAGPEQEAAHWVVETKEDADQEGVRLGGDLGEKLRVEWLENWIEIKGSGRGDKRVWASAKEVQKELSAETSESRVTG